MIVLVDLACQACPRTARIVHELGEPWEYRCLNCKTPTVAFRLVGRVA